MLIGFCGKMHSGKSTASKYLMENHGFRQESLAKPLKEMLRILGLTYEQVYGDEKDLPCALLNGKTPRHAMQTLGTEWGRNCIDENIWVRAAIKNFQVARTKGFENVVFDDVRFQNEVDAIHKAGGVVIKIIRGEQTYNAATTHVSEHDLRDVDFTFQNNGDVKDLFNFLDDIIDADSWSDSRRHVFGLAPRLKTIVD